VEYRSLAKVLSTCKAHWVSEKFFLSLAEQEVIIVKKSSNSARLIKKTMDLDCFMNRVKSY